MAEIQTSVMQKIREFIHEPALRHSEAWCSPLPRVMHGLKKCGDDSSALFRNCDQLRLMRSIANGNYSR